MKITQVLLRPTFCASLFALTLGASIGAAEATTLTFPEDLSVDSGVFSGANTLEFDAFDLTIIPAFFDLGPPLEFGTGGSIFVDDEGLGVFNAGGDVDPDIDGLNGNDALILLFDTPVELVSLNFDNVSLDDEFTLFLGEDDEIIEVIEDIDIPITGLDEEFDFSAFPPFTPLFLRTFVFLTSPDEGTFDFETAPVTDPAGATLASASQASGPSGPIGQAFAIGAEEFNDGFRLEGLTVNVVEPPTEVPLPATATLLLAGLAGLGARRLIRR